MRVDNTKDKEKKKKDKKRQQSILEKEIMSITLSRVRPVPPR